MHEDLLERAEELITEIMARVQDDILRKDGEIARLRAALEAVDWVWSHHWGDWECPWCGEVKAVGHAANCQRQTALGLGEGE